MRPPTQLLVLPFAALACGEPASAPPVPSFVDAAPSARGLVYTEPPPGGRVRLQRGPGSSEQRVELVLVAAQALVGYAVGFDLPLDATRAALAGFEAGPALPPGQ